MLKSPLKLIYKELRRRDIELWQSGTVSPTWQTGPTPAIDDVSHAFVDGAQDGFGFAWDSDLLEREYMDVGMTQDMYNVLSETEPISANVNIDGPFVGFHPQ